jgi:hypothetical protein
MKQRNSPRIPAARLRNFSVAAVRKKNREAERKKKRAHALAVAAKYRETEGPGHCGRDWYWNNKYRNCWRGTERKMLFYVFEWARKGRCMTVPSKKERIGLGIILWDCTARAQQQFKMIPIKKGRKDFYIQTTRGFCLRANTKGKHPNGAPILLAKCKNEVRQRWKLIKSRLVGHGGLCLRSQLLSQNRSKLILDNFHACPNIKLFKTKIAALKKHKAKVNKDYEKLIKPFKRINSSIIRHVIKTEKRKRDDKNKKINTSIKAQKVNLKSAAELIRNPSKTPLE